MGAIRLTDVTKTFGRHTAVDGLSLSVPRGSVYGFIGPNGSGKTTTLRMILHIIFPDRGQIEVLGHTDARAANDRIGYLPEERGLYKKMTLRRQLLYWGELKGMRASEARRAGDAWLEKLGLSSWGDKKIETLSKGMSQKVQFISAVIASPELVILDEPFTGLDPVNMEVLRGAILELHRGGTSVIFSTHDMAIAEQMCDFIFMIYKGRKVLDGTLDSIKEGYGADTVRLQLEGGRGALEGFPGIESVIDQGRFQDVRLRSGDAQQLLRYLTGKTAVHHFERMRPTLHDIFIRIAGPGAREVLEQRGGERG